MASTSGSLVSRGLRPGAYPFLIRNSRPEVASFPLSSGGSLISFGEYGYYIIIADPVLW